MNFDTPEEGLGILSHKYGRCLKRLRETEQALRESKRSEKRLRDLNAQLENAADVASGLTSKLFKKVAAMEEGEDAVVAAETRGFAEAFLLLCNALVDRDVDNGEPLEFSFDSTSISRPLRPKSEWLQDKTMVAIGDAVEALYGQEE